MSTVGGGVNIVTNGLVLYLDAANSKSLPNLVTNQFLWSEDFTNVSWFKSRMTITGSTTPAPYGSGSASTLSITGGYSAIQQSIGVPIGNYTVSYYVKYINQQYMTIVREGDPYGGATFDLINGTLLYPFGTSGFVTSASITAAPNGFYRISVTFNITQTSFVLAARLWVGGYNGFDNSGSQLYVWGGQFENGSSPTTYLPTTTTYSSNITTWGDLSKNTNNGTLVNNPTFNNTNGGSIVFDGVNDTVLTNSLPVNSPLSFTSGSFTLEHWIKPTGYRPNTYFGLTNMILAKGPSGTYNYATQVTNSTRLTFISRNNSENLKFYNFTVPSLTNVVSQAVFAITLTQILLYLNGTLISSLSLTGNPITPYSGDIITIGGDGGAQANMHFSGNMYSHRIYNRTLSAAEILQNYNATKTRFGL